MQNTENQNLLPADELLLLQNTVLHISSTFYGDFNSIVDELFHNSLESSKMNCQDSRIIIHGFIMELKENQALMLKFAEKIKALEPQPEAAAG